jgi:hypothetical protein
MADEVKVGASERKPLSPEYIAGVHRAAMLALADVERRRSWGNSKNGSPVATLSLCSEIARLNILRSEMVAALLNVRSIIAEAAMTGFNYKDGDWAERLFASQHVTSTAIDRANSPEVA